MMRLANFLPSLGVALGGVVVALIWFYASKPLAAVPILLAGIAGLAADFMAKRKLDHDDPISATKWIYGWGLLPLSLGIAAAAAVIVIAVALDPGDKPPADRKEIFSAASAAFGAFLVSAFIKDAETVDETWIGPRFKKRFQERFKNRFPRVTPASAAELAVQSYQDLGFEGWKGPARLLRAQIVAEALRPPTP
jgi:hypothetical protein